MERQRENRVRTQKKLVIKKEGKKKKIKRRTRGALRLFHVGESGGAMENRKPRKGGAKKKKTENSSGKEGKVETVNWSDSNGH